MTKRSFIGLLPWLAVALVFATGCDRREVRFRLNREGQQRQEFLAQGNNGQLMVDALTAVYGDPDDPYVWPDTGLDQGKLRLASGPAGDGAGLYRQHCAHCHGVSGDGLGPTARFLNPYPRDFRPGIFKYISTTRGSKPLKADLHRTVSEGLNGTAMPAFNVLLSEGEIEAVVEYVKYLAMRGETEIFLQSAIADLDGGELTADLLKEQVEVVAGKWNDAENQVVEPPAREREETPEALAAAIRRGAELFQDGKRANCVKCHGPTAMGDGGNIDYFDWDKGHADALKISPDAGRYYSLPLMVAHPRNLRSNVYRGGRRPIDIYRRIFAGINGTPMPGQGQTLRPQEIWDLVDYVLSLPYEPASLPQPLPEMHTTRSS